MAARPALMKGLLARQIRTNIIVATCLCAVTGVAMHYLYCEPRKQKYAEFYRTYNAEEDYVRMRELGLFQAARPQGNNEC